jgi:hypothetical protein
MTKSMETHLKQIEKQYAKKPKVAWLHRWVLTAFAEYASIESYAKALKAKKLSDNTVNARLCVVRRYLKSTGKFPKVVAPLAKTA